MVDTTIAPTVSRVLRQNPISSLQTIRVDTREKAIVLRGRVRSYYHKQLAQHAASAVAQQREVINEIEVVHPKRH